MYDSFCVTEGQNRPDFGYIPEVIKTQLDYSLYMLFKAQDIAQDNTQNVCDCLCVGSEGAKERCVF